MASSVTTKGTVVEGPKGLSTRVMRKDYPIEKGLTAGDTKQTGDWYLKEHE